MGSSGMISSRFFALRKLSSAPAGRDYKAEEYKFIRMVDGKFFGGRTATVLDLGCGEGALDALLSKHYSVTGVDKDAKAIRRARKAVAGVRFVNADMLRLDLPERFDMIVSVHAIDHGDALRKSFGSMLRIARKHLSERGIMIFDVTFLKELWENDPGRTDSVCDGATRYIRVFKHSVEGESGRYCDTFVRSGARGAASESYSGVSGRLLDLGQVTGVLEKLGFSIHIYDGWSNQAFRKGGKNNPVFVAVKR